MQRVAQQTNRTSDQRDDQLNHASNGQAKRTDPDCPIRLPTLVSVIEMATDQARGRPQSGDLMYQPSIPHADLQLTPERGALTLIAR